MNKGYEENELKLSISAAAPPAPAAGFHGDFVGEYPG